MNGTEIIITIVVLALSVQLTRFLPFVFFGESRKIPDAVSYLGLVLPAAMMGLLVIYCYKDYGLSSIMPALVAGIMTVIIHLWKRNTIMSIALGTAIYMILIRII